MKVRTARRLMGLATGLALIAAGTPAISADMGGIKDYGGAGGVPVPAPVPIPQYAAEWYFGVVGGGVLVDDSLIEEVGAGMPVRDSDELAKTLFGGISVGRYVAPNLRIEAAFDFYDDFAVAGPLEVNYTHEVPIEDSTVIANYDVTRYEKVKVGRNTMMLNVLYDIPLSTYFKPYIGGGVGVTWRSMKRRVIEDAECISSRDPSDPTFDGSACSGVPSDLRNYSLNDTTYETDRFDIALSAMAGVSVEVTPNILWDNGYQYLWESNGIELTTETHGGGDSTVRYSGTSQHQFRTGLRFLID